MHLSSENETKIVKITHIESSTQFSPEVFFPDSAMLRHAPMTHYAQEPSGCGAASDLFFTSVILHLPTTNLRHFAFSACSVHASNF